MRSRRANDAATSNGLRTGNTKRVVAPNASKLSFQKVSRRQMRGSFNTNKGLSPNSRSSARTARARNGAAAGELRQAGLNGPQSSHDEPPDARMASFSSTMTFDSQ